MKSTNLDQQIRERTQSFVAELTSLIKQSAVKSVRETFGNGDTELPTRSGMEKSGRGRGAKRAISSDEGEAAAPKGRGSKKKGAKRSPKQLVHITEKLLTQIKDNPGLRMEAIATRIGLKTKELALPVKKLVAEKKITRKGEKRATTYFAR